MTVSEHEPERQHLKVSKKEDVPESRLALVRRARRINRVLAETYPDAELILMGVEEPMALIHAPNESVDPNEISAMALTEARFLQRYPAMRG